MKDHKGDSKMLLTQEISTTRQLWKRNKKHIGVRKNNKEW